MIGLLCGVLAAWAATVEIVPAAGPLHPGVPAHVLVAVVGEGASVPTDPPRVELAGGAVRLEAQVGRGVWRYAVLPSPDARQAEFEIAALGRVTTRQLALTPQPEAALEVPRRVDALAGASAVSFVVTGADLPPPDALQVVTGSGEVSGVRAVRGGLEVTIDPGESPYPRYVPVGLRDARRDDAPVWTGLRVRTRPRVTLQTEPGTQLLLTVGGRAYGPFTADAQGGVAGQIEQYPGELVATAVLRDDLGNETTTSLPLSSHGQPALLAIASGPMAPGRAPPVVWLRGFHGDGHPWQGSPPQCRTSTVGEIGVVPIGPGAWRLSLFDALGGEQADLRVQCSLGSAVESVFRVPMADGVASRLRLRVWPDELSTDFPVAEVQAAVEDLRGERLPVRGLQLDAHRGEVRVDAASPLLLRGDYQGARAIEAGEDVIRARWVAPAGSGAPARIVVAHGPIPLEGALQVYGRALDVADRPLAGVPLALSTGGEVVDVPTDVDGWAVATLPLSAEDGVVVITARSAHRVARALGLPGDEARGGPGSPDLVAEHVVRISTGRGTDLFLEIDPPVLYTGGAAFAKLRVTVRDRAGNPVPDAALKLEASEGSIGPLRAATEGGQIADYTPPPGDKRRDVVITARHEGAATTARLLLEPRPVQRAVGLAFGVTTNFGVITAPFFAIDLDWRLPWLGGALMLRAGVGTYGDRTTVATGLGDDAQLSMVWVPMTLGLLGRRDMGGRALWLGIAGVVAPYRVEARIGADVAARGVSVLPPGLSVIGGLGQRLGGGEVMLEIRATTLTSPGGALTYQGPVGGLAAVLGYRLIY